MLRTAEFVPYVVFIEAPDFETLRAMNRAALESGVSTKQLTVRDSEVWWEGSEGSLGWWGWAQADAEKEMALGKGRGGHLCCQGGGTFGAWFVDMGKEV